MGQQVNFYLTPEDFSDLMLRVARCGDFVVIHSRSPEARPRVVPSAHFEEDGSPWLFVGFARPDDIGAIRMDAVSAQGYWGFDELRSPVIALTRCFHDGHILRRGRLYAVDGYYDENGAKVKKPEPFLRWARCVLTAARKGLARDPSLGAYLGPNARARTSEPGGLVLV